MTLHSSSPCAHFSSFSLHQLAPSKSNLSNVQELVIVTRREGLTPQPWASLSSVQTSKDRLPRRGNKSDQALQVIRITWNH